MYFLSRKFILSVLWCCSCFAGIQAQTFHIDAARAQSHPRLLLLPGEEEMIAKNIAGNAAWAKVHTDILAECDEMINQPPVERALVGRRLLGKSREGVRRIFFLSYAWRMTHKKVYLKRCEEELLAVAGFTDWNPDHFLYVAEMTMAESIGYDWL